MNDIVKIANDTGAATSQIKILGQDDVHSIYSNVRQGGQSMDLDELHGTTFKRGDSVQLFTFDETPVLTEDTRFEQYPNSTLNGILTMNAIKSAGIKKDTNIEICTTYPMNLFENSVGTRDFDSIQRKIAMLKAPYYCTTDDDWSVSVQEVTVIPETWAGAMYWSQVVEKTDIIKPRVFIDMGGQLTQMTVIYNHHQKFAEYTDFITVGQLDILEKLNEMLMSKYSITKSDPSTLRRLLDKKEYTDSKGEIESIEEYCNEATNCVLDTIQRFVEMKIRTLRGHEGFVYMGGGAAACTEMLEKRPHTIVCENPESANVLGAEFILNEQP